MLALGGEVRVRHPCDGEGHPSRCQRGWPSGRSLAPQGKGWPLKKTAAAISCSASV